MHFYHQNYEQLYDVMKCASTEETSADVLENLDKVQETCNVCQHGADETHRFRVSIPDSQFVFKLTTCMGIMFLDGDKVLHVVDKDRNSNAACFLVVDSTADVWEAFMCRWVSPYVSNLENIYADQGPKIKAFEWKNILNAAGINKN